MVKNRKRRMISLPFSLDEKLVEQAKRECRTVTNLLEKIVTDYLKERQQ